MTNWLKIEKATPDKPEIYEMAALHEIDPHAMFTKAFLVWAWFDDHTVDGSAPVTVKALLERITGVTGVMESFEKVGWASLENNRITILGFDKHTSASAKKRAQTAARVSESRAKTGVHSNPEQPEACNGQSVTEALPEKKRKDISKKEKETSAKKRPHTLPEDIDPENMPQKWRELAQAYLARKNITGIDLDDQFQKFCFHHNKLGNKFACWKSAWGTWYTNISKGSSHAAYQQPNQQRLTATEQQQLEINAARERIKAELAGERGVRQPQVIDA
jgi:chorismate mutase